MECNCPDCREAKRLDAILYGQDTPVVGKGIWYALGITAPWGLLVYYIIYKIVTIIW